MRRQMELHVNGEPRSVEVDTHAILLNVLRDELKLFGSREGCGIGMCGACTVLIDGKPVSSCIMLAVQAEGKDLVMGGNSASAFRLNP